MTGQEGNDNGIYPEDSSATAFNNAGTFVVAAGAVVSVPFANSGSVVVQHGGLSLGTPRTPAR